MDFFIIIAAIIIMFSRNHNPLKLFTIFNYKGKVISKEISTYDSKFVCNKCGNIFEY